MGTSDHVYQRYLRAFCADEPYIYHIVIYTWAVAICDIIKKFVKNAFICIKRVLSNVGTLFYVLAYICWDGKKKKKKKERKKKKRKEKLKYFRTLSVLAGSKY